MSVLLQRRKALCCAIAVGALLQPAAAATGLGDFRTDKVKNSFDPAKATGLWYEVWDHDIGQIGASCQTLTNTFNSSTGRLYNHFAVKYGPLPFSQTYTYEPDKSGERGVYSKYLPGAGILQLPTVVVDVADGADGKYSLLTEFTSKNVVVGSVTELRFSARTPTVTAEVMQKMKEVAASVGIKQSIIDSLQPVNHTGCPKPNLKPDVSKLNPKAAGDVVV